MSQIKSGKLGMKSRWVYVAKKIGLKSGLGLAMLILAFLINLFFFYIQANNLLPFLHEGGSTWQETLHSLPYDLILIILILIFGLNFIIKKFDFSYKKPFSVIFSVFIGLIIWAAMMLFISNFNVTIKDKLEHNDYYIPYLEHFYMERCPMHNFR